MTTTFIVLLLVPAAYAMELQCTQPSVLSEQMEELGEEIIVQYSPDDPCNFEQINNKLWTLNGGVVSWSASVDETYVPGGECRGRVIDDICYYQNRQELYARTGSTRYRRDLDSGGIVVSINHSGECRGESCAFPIAAPLNFLVPFENMYDVQRRNGVMVPCDPSNCYSISVGLPHQGGPFPGEHLITVTRLPSGELETKMYVNTGNIILTSAVARDGIYAAEGDRRPYPELLNRRADQFASCSDPYPRRQPSPVLPAMDLFRYRP